MTEQVTREKADQDSLQFINEVVESELLYVLVTDNNCLQTDSTEFVDENEEPLVAVPVWSKSFLDGAQKWAGPDAAPEEMTLDYFINEFVPQLEESHCTIGLNWDSEGMGREFAPFDLTDMLIRKINGEIVELPEHLGDEEQEK